MANIPLQLGDIATRLRRWTRAVGSLAVDLQPTAIQTVQLVSLDQEPYRTEPRSGLGHIEVVAGAAGNVSMFALQAAPGTALVVDAIWLEGVGVLQQVLVYIVYNQAFPTPTFTLTRTALVAINLVNPTRAGTAAPPFLGAQVQGANTLGATPPSGYLLSQITAAAAGTLSQYSLPNPLVLFGSQVGTPGIAQNPTGDLLIIVPTTAVQGFGGSVWAREFPLLQGAGNP